jgi:hypothetical protein
MRNIVTLFLVGLVVLELFSFGASGFEGTYFPEVNSYVNCTVLEAVNYSSGVAVAPSEICLDDNNRSGRGIAIFDVQNHSRIVSVQVVSNTTISGVNISVGKDGQYTEFGKCANFSMGISPDWNQTLEMYVHCEEHVSFELWATVVSGVVWRNGSWEIDNPNQPVQNVLVGIVTMKAESPSTADITASSPISLYFTAGGDAPKLIPHTVSAGILGEASQLLKGTEEADILAYYHVDFLEEKIYKTVSDGYHITAAWNLGNGTVHFNVTMEDLEDGR